MKLNYEKHKSLLLPVLMDASCEGGPDPAYWNFSEVTGEKWENLTILQPGFYGEEFNKTFGHYHTVTDPDETYKFLFGKAVFLLQEKFIENDIFNPKKVKRVLIVSLEPGEEITISNKWGHSWTNLGNTPIIMMDDWRTKSAPSRYEEIKNQKGMAYYFVKDEGSFKTIPNPNYVDLPEPEFITLKEFIDIEK